MTDKQREEYTQLLRERLSEYRFIHSVNVAAEAVELARLYGGDEEKAELAGLLHDIMKEAPAQEQLEYVKQLVLPDAVMLASKKVWHAYAGAQYCKNELGICDEEVLNAIRYHTSARAGMSLLEKIIYVADYTGAERDYDDVEIMRSLSRRSLDEAMGYALAYTIRSLVQKRAPIHPDTLNAYNDLIVSEV